MSNGMLFRKGKTGWSGVLLIMAAWGCGTKDSSPQKDAPTETTEAAVESSQKKETGRRTSERRSDNREMRDIAVGKGKGRERNNAEVRKWVEQDRYMRLALEHLSLSADQLDRLTDMNWRHFSALEMLKSERPSLDDALVKIMETGVFAKEGFEAERKHLEAIDEMRDAQYNERMRTLHDLLSKEQRAKLVGLVEAEQKQQYEGEDKRASAADKLPPTPGCGDRAARLFFRFVDERDLKRPLQNKLASLQKELNKDRLTQERISDLAQAGRIYDMAERKSFAGRLFELKIPHRPRSPVDEPADVTECLQKAFETFLGILTPKDRKNAVEKFNDRRARRRGETEGNKSPDAGSDDAKATGSASPL